MRQLQRPMDDLLAEMDDVDIQLPESLGAADQDPANQRRLKLFTIWTLYQERICTSARIRDLTTDETLERRATLVCAVADLLVFKGALTVAVLIVRESLLSTCKVYWDKPVPAGA